LPGINEQYIPPRAEDHPSYPFSRRDQEIEELLDNVFSADSPEYQTAPGLSLDERTNLCDIIDRIVEEFPDKLVLPWRIIPEALIARHRISYDIVEITKKPLMVPDDVDPFTHTIQATRRVRGDRVDIIEDKEVLFTRCEGHPIEVEERAHAIWPGETLPAKPLTVAELRRIQQALRDLYQES
jgi:hypothetical protein